jgi:hypothetical protein
MLAMLVLDIFSACKSPNTYNVTINGVYMIMRNYTNNQALYEDDVIDAELLEANLQYEHVQFGSDFKITMPGFFTSTAYAGDDGNYWSFTNRFSDFMVLAKAESGPDRNITSDCTFIYKGVEYTETDALAGAMNNSLNQYGQETGASPSIGLKVRFNENLANPNETQLIRVKTILTDSELLVSSEYLNIR